MNVKSYNLSIVFLFLKAIFKRFWFEFKVKHTCLSNDYNKFRKTFPFFFVNGR